ncbi:malate dehydrogenase [Methanospirillum lacunae]|uniref:malate dehydrogenase n=1 Tax=Methanospirillum lacunae TaxID=668570 RepID=A0A2V2MUD4_9EURY|nr:malate dehydrogenase [Methanospirillum lacunae]PWR69920.1 malate dehydrogenase [Methanospirillum lacunae]
MTKVTIIGATGRVGQYAALSISRIPYIREIQLYGRDGSQSLLDGITRDLIDSFAATGTASVVRWSCDLADMKGSDVVIITAGVARKPNQDRLDLAHENAKIVADLSKQVQMFAPESMIMMVTNPVDIMTSVALRYSGKKPHQVFGLGTHLDSMRLKSLIASFFQVHVSEVHTRIIGEHGESMVPLWSATTIGGIQISNLPSFGNLPIDDIMGKVRSSGQQIIASKGATVWGPGDAIATIIKTLLGNENRILTLSAYVKSEVHNIGDVCIGVPARINKDGVFPVSIRLDPLEVHAFQRSVERIRGLTNQILKNLEQSDSE